LSLSGTAAAIIVSGFLNVSRARYSAGRWLDVTDEDVVPHRSANPHRLKHQIIRHVRLHHLGPPRCSSGLIGFSYGTYKKLDLDEAAISE
jgi:hypothetical protein